MEGRKLYIQRCWFQCYLRYWNTKSHVGSQYEKGWRRLVHGWVAGQPWGLLHSQWASGCPGCRSPHFPLQVRPSWSPHWSERHSASPGMRHLMPSHLPYCFFWAQVPLQMKSMARCPGCGPSMVSHSGWSRQPVTVIKTRYSHSNHDNDKDYENYKIHWVWNIAGTVLRTFHVLIHSILTLSLQSRYHYYPLFSDEETEAPHC